MRIAIYSRKSKWTGKGESIENQLVMCKEYVRANFSEVKEEDISDYEDEGFSGKNTTRPQFQRMMMDLRKEHYDYLICYKLDRLGRNLFDFVTLIEELNQWKTSFISIKERFDTSTPIGRAMMYFTGVLAQMEREQIAERVRDNMLMLARSGRWLGGTTPLGFHSKKDEVITWNNKKKTSYLLTVNEEEMTMVRFIYREFLSRQSLSQLNTYFLQNNIKTRNSKEYQISTIRDILTNPVYCTADAEAYDYFLQLGCQVCIEKDELEGKQGIISYGKTSSLKYKNKKEAPTEWIISVAKHKGIIRGRDWVRVQKILYANKKKGDCFRKVQNPVSLLSGILYCKCGYAMRPKNYPEDRLDERGNRTFAYICSQKEKSKRKNCKTANIHGNTLDQLILKEVFAYTKPDNSMIENIGKLRDGLSARQCDAGNEIVMLNNIRNEKENRIKQLIVSLSKSDGNDSFVKYIEEQVNQFDTECKEIQKRITDISLTYRNEAFDQSKMDRLVDQIGSFPKSVELLSVHDIREYLRSIIEKVVWDGVDAHIYFRY
ncbi:MAG: Resolvase, N-terminal domain protein [Herbinix sp.]|nr:Resolvase, N-terminal domain protein [Herbinix sp.]